MLINHKHLSAAVVVLFFLFMSDIAIAQPGGGPGGRPMGPPPGGSNGRPSMSERERMRKQYQAYQAAEKPRQAAVPAVTDMRLDAYDSRDNGFCGHLVTFLSAKHAVDNQADKNGNRSFYDSLPDPRKAITFLRNRKILIHRISCHVQIRFAGEALRIRYTFERKSP